MTNLRIFETPPTRMLSKVQTAEILGISVSSLDRLMKANEIRFVRIGLRRICFQQKDIDEYLLANSKASQNERTRKNANLLAA